MSNLPRVILTETLDAICADWLAERAEVIWCRLDDARRFDELLPTADALVVRTYTQVNDDLLARGVKLKVIGRAGVGLDNFDLDACKKRGVAVVYTPDANTQAVVEYVLALILDHFRPRINIKSANCDFHAMRKTHVGKQIEELNLGILGFGRIGSRVGEIANAIGMNTYACDLLPEVELRKKAAFPFTVLSQAELLAASDVLTIHVDGRASNRNLIDAEALSQLRSDCLLINTSRGMVVDASALADWLKANPAGQAVIDVHDPEPPPDDYPLWGLPNARLLPHLASRTYPAMENMSWVVRDVMAVLAGETPTNPAF